MAKGGQTGALATTEDALSLRHLVLLCDMVMVAAVKVLQMTMALGWIRTARGWRLHRGSLCRRRRKLCGICGNNDFPQWHRCHRIPSVSVHCNVRDIQSWVGGRPDGARSDAEDEAVIDLPAVQRGVVSPQRWDVNAVLGCDRGAVVAASRAVDHLAVIAVRPQAEGLCAIDAARSAGSHPPPSPSRHSPRQSRVYSNRGPRRAG